MVGVRGPRAGCSRPLSEPPSPLPCLEQHGAEHEQDDDDDDEYFAHNLWDGYTRVELREPVLDEHHVQRGGPVAAAGLYHHQKPLAVG